MELRVDRALLCLYGNLIALYPWCLICGIVFKFNLYFIPHICFSVGYFVFLYINMCLCGTVCDPSIDILWRAQMVNKIA